MGRALRGIAIRLGLVAAVMIGLTLPLGQHPQLENVNACHGTLVHAQGYTNVIYCQEH